MDRRCFLKSAAGAAVLGLPVVRAAAEAKRPNILFILSDDHTSQAVGAYGGRLAALNPTPAIDALAQEGAVFENVFCECDLHAEPGQYHDGAVLPAERGARLRRNSAAGATLSRHRDEEGRVYHGDGGQMAFEGGTGAFRLLLRAAGTGQVP